MPPTRTPKQTSRKASTPSAVTDETDHPYVPRPPNAWILYRRATVIRLKAENFALYGSMNQKLLSKIISPMWRDAPAEVRKEYDGKADDALIEHMRMYPWYKYRPTTKAQKEALQAAKEKAADEQKARADEEKAAKAAARATSARTPRTRKTPSENDAPVAGPSQAAARPRKPRKSASSTSAAASKSRGADEIPGTGMFSLFDSDTESRLSSATPSLEYEGETLQHLPFALQATAPAFVPAAAPDSDFVQYTAPGIPPAPDASYCAPQIVQGWSAQAPSGDLLPNSAIASPASFSASDPLGLSREWYGLPPRDFFDETFPRHLPIAGLAGPIDLEDAMFALNNAQATGVAWLAHPPPVFVDAALPSQSPASAYDSPTANEDATLAPAIDAIEVHHAMYQPAVDAASPALTSEDSDMIDQVLAETFGTYRKSASCAELQAEIDELNGFLATLDEIKSMEASL
ncbi:hypothetical protein VTO73DRAFT_12829 [Trametes versicolor]